MCYYGTTNMQSAEKGVTSVILEKAYQATFTVLLIVVFTIEI